MNLTKFCTVVILLFTLKVQADVLPYLSPGFTIAWNSSGMKSASWKISIGFFSDKYVEKITGYFGNLTFGKRYLLDNFKKDYLFTECEAGIFNKYLLYGSGLGTAYLKTDDKIKIVPKGALFLGNILFLRSDFLISDKKLDLDIGGNIVIPLCKSYFNHISSRQLF